jgi:hypothetical protein
MKSNIFLDTIIVNHTMGIIERSTKQKHTTYKTQNGFYTECF